MKATAHICDICGQREIGTSERPKGWAKLRVPRCVELKRKTKGRTHRRAVVAADACVYCINAFEALAEKRAGTGDGKGADG